MQKTTSQDHSKIEQQILLCQDHDLKFTLGHKSEISRKPKILCFISIMNATD